MSRGLGRVERQVLRTLDMNPGKWVRLTGPGTGRSRASSVRRAAHSLASKGLVELKKTYRDGTVRLSARRATDTRILPDDLDSLLPAGEKSSLLGLYAEATLDGWNRRLDAIRRGMMDDLWRTAVGSGLDLDTLKAYMASASISEKRASGRTE